MTLEQTFRGAMVNIYVRAWKECRYPANRFLQMIDKQGALQAAKTLLAKGGVSSGFKELWECGRLDLTVEALVIKAPWSALFTEDEIRTARERLADLDYKEMP